MNYYEVQFTYTSPIDTEIINDVLASELGEIGFESFTSNENGLTAYVSEKLYNTEAIKDKITSFPLGPVTFRLHRKVYCKQKLERSMGEELLPTHPDRK